MAWHVMQCYLLSGLALHKAVWEVMKRRSPGFMKREPGRRAYLLSAIKVAILVTIGIQIFLPDILPISDNPGILRGIGLVFYSLGLVGAITARIQLGMNWSDIEKSVIKKDHKLVNHGLYAHVRHPIYTCDLMLLFGLEIALNSWGVAGTIALAIYIRRQVIKEERALIEHLPGYADYCNQTSRFVPFLAS